MTTAQCWHLARLWYRGRLDRDWERAGPERVAEIFSEVGLEGEFWSLE